MASTRPAKETPAPALVSQTKRAKGSGPAVIVVVAVVAGLALLYGKQEGSGEPDTPASADRAAVSRTPAVSHPATGHVGSAACAECHPSQFAAWKSSQHAVAMQHADAGTVLGDFREARFPYSGITSTFRTRDGRFFVETDGPDGRLAEFEIAYTFGVDPMQQYLVAMPGGRLQALGIAWDSRPAQQGGQRWFHLEPDGKVDHTDELHWTRPAQNWNFMCADCHSTDVRKNHDEAGGTYETTWKEIAVGCEACHGPGSTHVRAARSGEKAVREGDLTVRFLERRGVRWVVDAGTGNAKRSEPRTSGTEIQACAQCHARRSQVADGYRPGDDFHDFYRASALAPGLYHADGQQRGEVYVWGSFEQSRMHQAGVTCSDCHDPHTQKLRAEGNAVCAGCHLPSTYDSTSHHRHPQGSTGAACVGCHMPETTYMVLDPRRDHSLRVPRPDVSVATGSPDACSDCHRGKDAAWAAGVVRGWGIEATGGYQQYATAYAAAAAGNAEAASRLVAVATGPDKHPAIARAGALELLAAHPGALSAADAGKVLEDPDPLVRRAAATALQELAPQARLPLLAPLLSDPVRTVRIEAAQALADAMQGATDGQRDAFAKAAAEFEAAQHFQADRPEGRAALGTFYARQGRFAEGESRLRAALDLDPRFVPAYVNLGDLYRAAGRHADSEAILRTGVQQAPESADLHHALGLALVRSQRTPQALPELQQASALAPGNARYAYVTAVALRSAGQAAAALAEIRRALAHHPDDVDLLMAGVSIGQEAGDAEAVRSHLQELLARHPDDPRVRSLLQQDRRAH